MSNQPGNSAEGTQTGVVPEQVQPPEITSESNAGQSSARLKQIFEQRRNRTDQRSVSELLRQSQSLQSSTKVQ